MSGMYGTVKPANINIENDVEIFYHFRPSLNNDDTNFSEFQALESNILEKCSHNGDYISGLYNLKLPLDIFNKKGIYTIYIRPKEIEAKIENVGNLSAFPDVRGIIFNADDEGFNNFKTSNALVGYRIDYKSNDNNDEFKIITSSNLAKAESTPTVRYTLGNDGGLIFCTVTPSLAPTFNPNNLPNIGKTGDVVKLVNTKFNPIMIELELVEHDAETISYMIEGNQLVDKDNAIITTFNTNGDIYHQSEYGVYKDNYGNPLYEFKKKKDNVIAQSFENLE
jgi:hypothetical protein